MDKRTTSLCFSILVACSLALHGCGVPAQGDPVKAAAAAAAQEAPTMVGEWKLASVEVDGLTAVGDLRSVVGSNGVMTIVLDEDGTGKAAVGGTSVDLAWETGDDGSAVIQKRGAAADETGKADTSEGDKKSDEGQGEVSDKANDNTVANTPGVEPEKTEITKSTKTTIPSVSGDDAKKTDEAQADSTKKTNETKSDTAKKTDETKADAVKKTNETKSDSTKQTDASAKENSAQKQTTSKTTDGAAAKTNASTKSDSTKRQATAKTSATKQAASKSTTDAAATKTDASAKEDSAQKQTTSKTTADKQSGSKTTSKSTGTPTKTSATSEQSTSNKTDADSQKTDSSNQKSTSAKTSTSNSTNEKATSGATNSTKKQKRVTFVSKVFGSGEDVTATLSGEELVLDVAGKSFTGKLTLTKDGTLDYMKPESFGSLEAPLAEDDLIGTWDLVSVTMSGKTYYGKASDLIDAVGMTMSPSLTFDKKGQVSGFKRDLPWVLDENGAYIRYGRKAKLPVRCTVDGVAVDVSELLGGQVILFYS